MISIQVGDIKLQYDESVNDIERIVEIIKINQYLFTDYSGKTILLGRPKSTESDDIVYISDFDEFFNDLLKMLLEDKKLISSLEDPDLLRTLYIQLLVKKAIQNGDNVSMPDSKISDDMLWFMIACNYFDYKTNFDELSNFLKYRRI